MPYLIVNTTQDNSFIHRVQAVGDESTKEWPEESQAQTRCDKANADAEALGIKTRYEVKEA